jgi:hypothetical protein
MVNGDQEELILDLILLREDKVNDIEMLKELTFSLKEKLSKIA